MSQAICVYCGARAGADPAHEAAAHQLGTALAARGWTLVYGGGNVGLMGVLARSALTAGGEVIGVIPQALLDVEVGLRDVSQLVVTDTLRERKAIMDSRADAFVALPGGFGTLEELMEVLTLRQLRYHNKPIIIVNQNGYYASLLSLFDHLLEQGFIARQQMDLFDVVADVDEAVDRLELIQQQEKA